MASYAAHDFEERPLAQFPTSHPPGSKEKIEIMRLRAERGEAVFHPLDAKFAKMGPEPQTKFRHSDSPHGIQEIVVSQLSTR